MTKPKKQETDQTAGNAAFLELEPRLRAIPTRTIAYLNIGAAQAATAAIALAHFVSQPEMRKRFAALPEFDIGTIADLEKSSWALFFLQAQVQTSDATASDMRVPLATMDNAGRIRGRMLKLLTYYLDADPTAASELADIRAGAGYLDLATDLMRLATLHEQHKEIVKDDPLTYRAGDAKDARAVAREILGALGEETKEEWTDLRNRAYTLLMDCHEEVCAAGRFLCRKDPENLDRFAPLRTLAGIRGGRKKPGAVPPTPPAEDSAKNGAP